MEAGRTRDPFYVMSIAGHKAMQSLMFYIDLAKVVFGPGEHEVYTRQNCQQRRRSQCTKEAGFGYVTGEYAN